MLTIKAPKNVMVRDPGSTTIFLAGSIAMGKVEDWQAEAEDKLGDYSDAELTVFNPRRDDFDDTLEQTASNPTLNEQINWEIDSMEEADYILMYFHPDTYAPITLLELGLHVHNIVKVVVCCPNGFYRQANVEIVCKKYDIPFFRDLDDAIDKVRTFVDYDHNITRYDTY